jgi:hypothetical protein
MLGTQTVNKIQQTNAADKPAAIMGWFGYTPGHSGRKTRCIESELATMIELSVQRTK